MTTLKPNSLAHYKQLAEGHLQIYKTCQDFKSKHQMIILKPNPRAQYKGRWPQARGSSDTHNLNRNKFCDLTLVCMCIPLLLLQ